LDVLGASSAEVSEMQQAWIIAPGITSSDISDPPTFEEKLQIFERSVLGWQLEIAEIVINGSEDHHNILGSGYAVLSIVASYPEMIWQFANGCESKNRSREAFREGLAMVFSSLDLTDSKSVDALNLIYDELRCGLYHDGKARRRVILGGDSSFPIELVGSLIKVNPHLLPRAFIAHFKRFVKDIRVSGEAGPKGENFVRYFDAHW
jgi:hypothetical protein